MTETETRLKIAVFIDFDNIEIGVKTTLNRQFDIAAILEGIKERGEVVTKVAYGDWKRAGDHGRLLSQHAIHMVQRNLTPGGDKNGADINLALDALEMAFTRQSHQRLRHRRGRQRLHHARRKAQAVRQEGLRRRRATSSRASMLQKNCHEFIAYENLIGASGRRASGGGGERRGGAPVTGALDVAKALPLVRRALKVLADREVSPQLGLLKSTLLQLDSTFSERDYGVSTFRDFIEKVAQTGVVTLRHAGRSLLVDLAEDGGPGAVSGEGTGEAASYPAERAEGDVHADSPEGRPAEPRLPLAPAVAPDPEQAAAAVQRVREAFADPAQPPRWPMYVRQVKQFLRAIDEGFDERKYGFNSIVDFLRACQREGLLRLERDRQGVLRVFPGGNLKPNAPSEPVEPGNEAQPESHPTMEAPPQADASPEDGEEVREGYGPMAELLAEAAEPMLTIEAEIPPEEGAAAQPEKVTFIVSPGEPDEIDPEDLRFNVEPSLLPKPKRAVGGGRKGGGPARGPRKPAPGRVGVGGGSRTARTPRGRKKAD